MKLVLSFAAAMLISASWPGSAKALSGVDLFFGYGAPHVWGTQGVPQTKDARRRLAAMTARQKLRRQGFSACSTGRFSGSRIVFRCARSETDYRVVVDARRGRTLSVRKLR